LRRQLLIVSIFAVFVAFAATIQGSEKKQLTPELSPHIQALLQLHSRELDTTALFLPALRCKGCHGHDPMGIANVNLAGVDINLFDDWETSMMGLAGVDPLWRAKVRQEVLTNPSHANELQTLCTSCHAPMGHFAAIYRGAEHYTLEDLQQDSLGLSGVGCLGCHSIGTDGLGQRFTGDIPYDTSKVAFGPFINPMTGPMQLYVNFTPTYSPHVSEGRFCSPCHTLISNTVDLEGVPTGSSFVEQATYHEWLNSVYPSQERSCQNCHMPQIEDPVKIAVGYTALPGRSPFNLHSFAGSNSFMVDLIKRNKDVLGINASDANFDSTLAAITQVLKHQTLNVELSDPVFDGDTASFEVLLTNKAGHKFPSGYPARRAVVEFIVISAAGDTIFQSGTFGGDGEIRNYGGMGEPHHDVIRSENQVQIYEMLMGDVNGNFTTVLERAATHLKDNRLLPLGFVSSHPSYDTIAVVGEASFDEDFNRAGATEGTGKDILHYHVAMNGYSGEFKAFVRVNYQAVPPAWLDEMRQHDAPEINLFLSMYDASDKSPVRIAGDSLTELLSPLSIQDRQKLFSVFPNPANAGQDISIRLGQSSGTSLVTIYTLQGKLVYQQGHVIQNGVVRIQPKLAAGAYLVAVEQNNQRFAKRIVISSP
jgi:hypothetical protein